jgi:hypothetical protein
MPPRLSFMLIALVVAGPAAAQTPAPAPLNQSIDAGLRAELRDVRFPDSSFGYPIAGIRFAF